MKKTYEAILKSSRAGRSMYRTQVLGIKVSEEVKKKRLAVCETCPSATRRKDGTLLSCGPMLRSEQNRHGRTCGCILELKAQDPEESCPQGKWSL